ncbi:MAG: DUF4214 domain-containing protein [Pirellulales bacterium]|nr:DUF4214 domain-containing protein [Pirellulales bacterium]
MKKQRRRRRTLRGETLEVRLAMAGPTPYAGTPVVLPDGTWQHTPFVGSPVFADLNNDGREEILTAAAGGRLIAFSNSGGTAQVFKTYDTLQSSNFKSTPAVVTLPDGRKAIFAALGRDENNSGAYENDYVYGWDAATGAALPGWPLRMPRNVANMSGAYGAIATGDLTGDGVPEIVVTSFSHFVDAYKLDGTLLWRYNADDTILSGAAIGDLDRDGRNEVVFGSDASDSIYFQHGGFINILDNTGGAKFRYHIDEVVWSSPVLVDLNGNGTLEIVVGTGLNFDDMDPRPGARAAGNRVYALDYNGALLPGWPYKTTNDDSLKRQVLGSPAAADLNGDGIPEVIVADRGGFLHVITGAGTALTGWAGGKQIAQLSAPQDGYASPIVADIDGDGQPDIVAANGPNLTGFNRFGTVIFTNVTGGNPPESRFNAAAVGQWDGVGGMELVSVSNVSAVPDRPRLVSVFQLPASTLEAPWRMLRHTADNVAVQHSTAFLQSYVTSVYRGLLGRDPSAGERNTEVANLANNRTDLFRLAQAVASSVEARNRVIDTLYLQLLNRTPDAGGRAYWQSYLATNPAKNMAVFMMVLPEFFAQGGGTTAGAVTLMYQRILHRTPSAGEVNSWVSFIAANGLDAAARFFWTSNENLTNHANALVQAAFGGSFTIQVDALQSAMFNLRFDRSNEELIAARTVASGGNYAQTDNVVAWLKTLYRDVLNRNAGPAEIVLWLQAVERGEVGLTGMADFMVRTPEAKAVVVDELYRNLLGRAADAAAITTYGAFNKREDVIIALVSSPEYFVRNGNTNTGFVQAAFRDLAGINPLPQAALNQWLNLLATGTPRAQLPTLLVASAEYYNKQVVDFLFRYLPDESQGVLRTGNLPGNAAGQPVNPNPALVSYLMGLRQQGATGEAVLVTLLSSPQYVSRSSYAKGLFRSVGVRN